MNAYVQRLAHPGAWAESPVARAGARLGRKLALGLRHMQYAQMVSVLSRVPDPHLEEAGLRRCDIPEIARRSVYGDDWGHR